MNKTSTSSDSRPPTAAEVLRLLSYCPETGQFRWIGKPSPRIAAGALAGTVTHNGYRHIKVGDRYFKAHRLAWLCSTGLWPADQIDHINGDRDDNRIANLRAATRSLNMQNLKAASAGKRSCTYLGVHQLKGSRRFYARIRIQGRSRSLGTFTTAEAAFAAYVEAKRQHHAGCTI